MGKFESGIQSRFVDAAVKRYGGLIVIRVKHGDAYATVGDPDVYGCLAGHFFGIEIKNENGELTKIQIHRLREIITAGGVGAGIRSVEEGMLILDGIVAAAERPDWRR